VRKKHNSEWTACSDRLPEFGVIVDTKIHDEYGCRNERRLKRHSRVGAPRDLWFYPHGMAHVYYTPTHWRPIA
jgi:hypothetical protein